MNACTQREDFFQEFFIRQHLQRLEGNLNHIEPWYFYLVVFAVGTIPWMVFSCGYMSFKRQVLQSLTSNRARLVRFCLVWMSVTVALFSLSSAKLATYIVSAVVPFSILIANSFDYLTRLRQYKKILIAGWSAAITLSIAPLLCSFGGVFWSDRDDLITLVSALALAPIALVFAQRMRTKFAVVNVVVLGLVASITLSLAAAFHLYDEKRNRSLHNLYKIIERQPGSAANFMRFAPGALFYVKRPIQNLSTTDDYLQFVKNSPAPHLVITEKRVSNLVQTVCPGLVRIKSDGDFSLLEQPGK